MAIQFVVLALFAAFLALLIIRRPKFDNLQALDDGNLKESQQKTVDTVTELNKYLISISTLLFGAIGFYLTYYKAVLKITAVPIAFGSAFLFLGITYYFAFLVYARVTAELAQDSIGLQPRYSKILYYLEMEFWAATCASLILLSIFVMGVFQGAMMPAG